MVKRYLDQKFRLRNFDARHGEIETGAGGVERRIGECTSGEKKASVRRETSAVSGTRVTVVLRNRHRKPLHPLCHQLQEVDLCRKKEASEAEVRLAEFFDNRADTFCKVLVRDLLVSIGILPNVNFLSN